jgi:hypothetical protein
MQAQIPRLNKDLMLPLKSPYFEKQQKWGDKYSNFDEGMHGRWSHFLVTAFRTFP